MHEFSLAQDVLGIVLDSARQHGLRAVTEVRLEVGRASGVSIEAFSFAWEYLRTTETATAEATLELDRPAAHGACDACGFSGEVDGYLRVCPRCQALGLRLTGGAQFLVTGISGE